MYEYKFVEDFKLPENVSNAQSLLLSNKLYLESKGIKDDFSTTMQYSVCKKNIRIVTLHLDLVERRMNL